MEADNLHYSPTVMFRGTSCIYPRCVDLRTGAFDVPPQEILTKDSVTVSVDAVVYYQVNGTPINYKFISHRKFLKKYSK